MVFKPIITPQNIIFLLFLLDLARLYTLLF